MTTQVIMLQTVFTGDGANDVNMIQAADIGIGISGQEGMQVGIDFTISKDIYIHPTPRLNHSVMCVGCIGLFRRSWRATLPYHASST